MSRIRYIKPGFFCDEDLADCSPWARLLFAGLWGIADKAGRLEDRPRRIAAAVFPYDRDVDVEECLRELCEHGPMIVRYEVGGMRYIAIPGWEKHQKPHWREADSTIPAPSMDEQCVNDESTMDHPLPAQPNGDGQWVMGNGDGQWVMGNGNGVNPLPDSGESCECAVAILDDFDVFWAAYPRHEAKAKSRIAWSHLTKGERTLAIGVAEVMSALVASGKQEKRFVPHATTFIHGKRWDDWREGVPPAWGGDDLDRQQAHNEAIRRAVEQSAEPREWDD